MYGTFNKWYSVGSGAPIKRRVIRYPAPGPRDLSFPLNPNAVREGRNRTKLVQQASDGSTVLELELSKLFFLGFRISEDGDFPQMAPPPPSRFKQLLGMTGEKRPVPSFVEIYISR